MPDLLDLGRVDPAIVGERHLGEAGRDADAQPAGDQLEQRPATGGVQRVQPAGDHAGQGGFARRLKRGHHLVQAGGQRRPASGSGHISAAVSARSPTKS